MKTTNSFLSVRFLPHLTTLSPICHPSPISHPFLTHFSTSLIYHPTLFHFSPISRPLTISDLFLSHFSPLSYPYAISHQNLSPLTQISLPFVTYLNTHWQSLTHISPISHPSLTHLSPISHPSLTHH